MDRITGFSLEAIRYFRGFADIATLRMVSSNRSNSVDTCGLAQIFCLVFSATLSE